MGQAVNFGYELRNRIAREHKQCKREGHLWGAWSARAGYRKRSCLRCPKVEEQAVADSQQANRDQAARLTPI